MKHRLPPRLFAGSNLNRSKTIPFAMAVPPEDLLVSNKAEEIDILIALRNEFARTLDQAPAIHASDLEVPFIRRLEAVKGWAILWFPLGPLP